MDTTDGHLLGGRLIYRQPTVGFRSGIEPVLLAASIPARPGDHVLEAGSGAGAALLCLAGRVPGVHVTGVEIDPETAALAVINAGANRFPDIAVVVDPIETVALPRRFDHAMANPPYHLSAGSVSPIAVRETAKRGSETMITGWIERLSRSLRPRGSLTLIVPASAVPVCLSAMAGARCGCTAIFPLWPKTDRPAKLVLLRGVKDSRAPLRLMPGLIMHRPDGSLSDAAQAVLRDAAPLPVDTP